MEKLSYFFERRIIQSMFLFRSIQPCMQTSYMQGLISAAQFHIEWNIPSLHYRFWIIIALFWAHIVLIKSAHNWICIYLFKFNTNRKNFKHDLNIMNCNKFPLLSNFPPHENHIRIDLCVLWAFMYTPILPTHPT